MFEGVNQDDNKQLTTFQANESRLVTKCRWVIEVINAFLKGFKALDNVKNVTLPHLMIDFKIAAAFINLFYKKLFSDGVKQSLIAKLMLEKMELPNKLEPLINKLKLKRLELFEKMNAALVTDFPKLDEEDIKTYITNGSYQVNQSLGYLAEHFKTNGEYVIYLNRKNHIENNCNYLRAKVHSRHINRKTYDVFIGYFPNQAGPESIDSWFCTCRNGKRTVGCCSHIASIIYYLSCAKYLVNIRTPAGFLDNLIIPTLLNDSDQDLTPNTNTQTNDSLNQSNSKSLFADSGICNNDSSLCSTLKHSLSIQSNISTPNKIKRHEKSQRIISTYSNHVINNFINMRLFTSHIPSWGGKINTAHITDRDLKNIKSQYEEMPLENTCTIDYLLFALWCSSKISSTIRETLQSDVENTILKKIDLIVSLIDLDKWNEAKTVWILEFVKIKPSNGAFSVWGCEHDNFINLIKCLQTRNYVCKNYSCKDAGSFKQLTDFYFYKKENTITCSLVDKHPCMICCSKENTDSQFMVKPCWIFFQCNYDIFGTDDGISINELPTFLTVDNLQYNLLMTTISTPNHFKSIFFLNKNFYLIDDLNIKTASNKIPIHKVRTCVYFIESKYV